MKLAVALIHGIGDQPDSRNENGLHSYARELVVALRRRLGVEADEVTFQSLYWVSVLDARELDYLKRIEREPLGWRWLHRVVTLFLGDASDYRKVSAAYDIIYQQVHQHVRSGIMALRARVRPQTPLAIPAHSLGGHIVFDFIWDQWKLNRTLSCSIDLFLDLETLAGLVTSGCNISLFTFAYEKVYPIRFPGHCLTPTIRQQARWLSVYAPADPFGYPLRPLQNYAAVVHEDLALPAGPWYKRHTLLSHMEYWSDVHLHDYLVDYLCRLLVAGLEPADAGRAPPAGEPGDRPLVEPCRRQRLHFHPQRR